MHLWNSFDLFKKGLNIGLNSGLLVYITILMYSPEYFVQASVFKQLRTGVWKDGEDYTHFNKTTTDLICVGGTCTQLKGSTVAQMLKRVGEENLIKSFIKEKVKKGIEYQEKLDNDEEVLIKKKREEIENLEYDKYGFEHGINDQFFEATVFTHNLQMQKKIENENTAEENVARCRNQTCHNRTKHKKTPHYYLKYETKEVPDDEFKHIDEHKLRHKYHFDEKIELLKGMYKHQLEVAEKFYEALPEDHKTDPTMLSIGCHIEFKEPEKNFEQHYKRLCKVELYKPDVGNDGWVNDSWNTTFYRELKDADFETIFKRFNATLDHVKSQEGICVDCQSFAPGYTLKWNVAYRPHIDSGFCEKSTHVIHLGAMDDADENIEINLIEGFKGFVKEGSGEVEMGCIGDIHRQAPKNFKLFVCCKTRN